MNRGRRSTTTPPSRISLSALRSAGSSQAIAPVIGAATRHSSSSASRPSRSVQVCSSPASR
ncbi:hypothetical protein ACIRN4_07390 [Pimelobacter simplex]|uniref:hypothetical protein n=1 Tax=Nocardioides simplex TaxID=2045 RepID=UPI0038076213